MLWNSKLNKIWLATLGLSAAIVVTAFGQSAAPDLVLYNGKIFTSNEARPYAQAIAIRGERITGVGDSETIKGLAGRNTKLLDLGGRTVIPGINDAHYHLSVTPKDELDLDIKTANPSLDEIRAAIASATPKAQAGTIIVGEIGESAYFDADLNRSLLDNWSPHSPVVLFTVSAHTAILN